MMAKNCKYCDRITTSKSGVCDKCEEKLVLIRQIRKMLLPYYKREKRGMNINGNQRQR